MVDLIKQLFTDAIGSTDGNQFLSAGLILGTITAVLMGIKQWGMWVVRRVIRAITYSVYIDNSSSMYSAVSDWYYKNYPHKFKSVEAVTEYNELDGERNVRVKYRQFDDFNTLWFKRRFLIIQKTKKTLESAMSLETRSQDIYEISGFFARKAIESLIQESYEFYKESENTAKGVKIYHHTEWGGENYRQILTDVKPLSKIFIKERDEILQDITKFLSKAEFYRSKGIKCKRSYLLSGPGGTGKSSLVTAIAAWLNKRIYYINPGKLTGDGALDQVVHNISPGSIILFEDIDIFFTNRERKENKKTTRVSFQAILNVLDGANSPADVLIFMTTNHAEKLDPALVRKGRVDYHAVIDFPDKEEVQSFVEDYYEEVVTLPENVKPMPMAAVQDICLRSEDWEKAVMQL